MKRIPNDVVRRLPIYLRKLDDLYAKGEKTISSGQLCRQLGMEPKQFRQDMAIFGNYQHQTIYFDIDEIRHVIGEALGTYEEFSAVLIGTGKIGSALLEHFKFIVDGYDVLGAFDVSPEKIGTELSGVKIRDMAELGGFVRDNGIDIAILTVPRASAQPIADILVENGIKAIWNFTNTDLDVGDSEVLVENVHFSDSLLTLNYYLALRREEET